jgi:hypothetical protein
LYLVMAKYKTKIDDLWRVCTYCFQYKLFSFFNKDWLRFKTKCRDCQKEIRYKYNHSPEWKQKNKNYRIIRKVKGWEELKNKTKLAWDKWKDKNKEKIKEKNKRFFEKHKERIYEERREKNEHYFWIWKKVYYNNQIWKIIDYKYKVWCLVCIEENNFKIWVWKNKLKPFKIFK